MNFLLLLGAGFSRNWGGWLASEVFDYLLGCREIRQDHWLPELMWKFRQRGFEYALDEVQREAAANPSHDNSRRLADMNAAVSRMLEDLNASIAESSLEFCAGDPQTWISAFLAKFRAIFSLNQDLLLERCYLSITFSQPHHGAWAGHDLPGMEIIPRQQPMDLWQRWGRLNWQPREKFEFRTNYQPLFKMHGSANWRTRTGGNLLVMGGDKTGMIRREPVLAWYMETFEKMLQQKDTRLMIIGYGFLDPHINAAIESAVEHHGLRFFNIAPEGAGHAHGLNATRMPGSIGASTSLERAFEQGLIGASRRRISETFGSDERELTKVYRFFEA